jgi:hypothetical protein
MATTKVVGAMPAGAEATVTTSTAGEAAMSKSAGQSRSGPKQEIRAEWAARQDLGQNDAPGPDLGRAGSAGSAGPPGAAGAIEPPGARGPLGECGCWIEAGVRGIRWRRRPRRRGWGRSDGD